MEAAMTPIFHPSLVNSSFEDPCVYVDFLFNRRAILFDLGTLTRLPIRKILRISHVFVSHTHIDHFIGFDHLLRLCLGREKRVHLFGPPGFVDQVGHRLASYSWNLVYSYDTDFTIIAQEVHPEGNGLSSEFHCQHGFKPENSMVQQFTGNLIHDEEGLSVHVAVLDHKIASLAFSLEEKLHVNIMKNRLDEMGLLVGPWLKELKSAIMGGKANDTPIRAVGRKGITILTLKELREQAVKVEAGQKVCYVTDAAFTPDNAERIVALTRDADYLFIETTFPEADAGLAAERCHLTARQAGELARRAGAVRVIPFHFSPRYTDQEQDLRIELERAWRGDVL
jgi:ribonuclease Z